ncbi:MAG: hypothetical protein KDC53_18885, partial [Saprospiraceae bacterium]|nr:hypothetical protein [Saprospiraceae bacterium]
WTDKNNWTYDNTGMSSCNCTPGAGDSVWIGDRGVDNILIPDGYKAIINSISILDSDKSLFIGAAGMDYAVLEVNAGLTTDWGIQNGGKIIVRDSLIVSRALLRGIFVTSFGELTVKPTGTILIDDTDTEVGIYAAGPVSFEGDAVDKSQIILKNLSRTGLETYDTLVNNGIIRVSHLNTSNIAIRAVGVRVHNGMLTNETFGEIHIDSLNLPSLQCTGLDVSGASSLVINRGNLQMTALPGNPILIDGKLINENIINIQTFSGTAVSINGVFENSANLLIDNAVDLGLSVQTGIKLNISSFPTLINHPTGTIQILNLDAFDGIVNQGVITNHGELVVENAGPRGLVQNVFDASFFSDGNVFFTASETPLQVNINFEIADGSTFVIE